jgi:hypothetical protein
LGCKLYDLKWKNNCREEWSPVTNIFSIPANGSVVNAFKKYGWGWGGDWKSSKDYMHFSYFGN